MSKVAARFWNSKVHKQLDAKANLKALGILTGDEVSVMDELVQKTRQVAPAFAKAVMSYKSPLMEAIKRGKIK